MRSRRSWAGRQGSMAMSIVLGLIVSCICFTVCTDPRSTVSKPDASGAIEYTVWPGSCKEFEPFPEPDVVPPHRDCLAYTYNTDFTLDLKHINAGFNCCPGQFKTTITADDTLITVETVESIHGCRCTCLFDLDYEVKHVAPGIHRIKIIEQCLGEGDEQLDFVVDLSLPTSGISCVERTHTPWDWPIF
jgi:hypothetical protein